MIFRHIVHITESTPTDFGQKLGDVVYEVKANLEATGGLRRGGFYDVAAGDARACLDASDDWLQSVGYEIAKFYLISEKFGITKVYRIENVAPGERHATTGELSHIEVELMEVKRVA